MAVMRQAFQTLKTEVQDLKVSSRNNMTISRHVHLEAPRCEEGDAEPWLLRRECIGAWLRSQTVAPMQDW
jgi:hypothetical protein